MRVLLFCTAVFLTTSLSAGTAMTGACPILGEMDETDPGFDLDIGALLRFHYALVNEINNARARLASSPPPGEPLATTLRTQITNGLNNLRTNINDLRAVVEPELIRRGLLPPNGFLLSYNPNQDTNPLSVNWEYTIDPRGGCQQNPLPVIATVTITYEVNGPQVTSIDYIIVTRRPRTN